MRLSLERAGGTTVAVEQCFSDDILRREVKDQVVAGFFDCDRIAALCNLYAADLHHATAFLVRQSSQVLRVP